MRSSWFIRILGGIAALGLVGSACTPPPGPPGTPDQLIEIYGLIGNEIYASPPVSLPGTIPYDPVVGGVWEVDGSVVTTANSNRFDITAQLVLPSADHPHLALAVGPHLRAPGRQWLVPGHRHLPRNRTRRARPASRPTSWSATPN